MNQQQKNEMTQDAYNRLKEELDQLEGEGRRAIIEAIATARAHGDLSENAEYHAARDQQGMQEARVRQIKQQLEDVVIVEVKDDGVIKPGKLVTLKMGGDDEAETYLLGLREEKGGEHDVLTPESPLGRSLVGHSAGEKVTAQVPTGELEIEIVSVRTP